MIETEKRPPRLMFVDDDVDMIPLYEMIGRIDDTLITVRKGGLSALSFLHDLNYEVDAVILDLSMPDMDGITLTEQIRRNESLRGKRTPIAIFWFTGWEYDADNPADPIALAKEENKVEKIFRKPIAATDILHEVKSYLNA